MACVNNDNDLREVVPGEGRRRSPACPRALSWSFTPLPWPNRVKTPVRCCSAELTMLSPFASTHSKVAEQQVIRTFVTGGPSVEESLVQFASWEEASKAGKLALNQFLQTPLGSRFIRPAHA